MDLIALQLGALLARRVHDNPPRGVHFHGHLVAPFRGMAEEPLQHVDDVLEAMIVVVDEDDVVGRLPFDLVLAVFLGPPGRFRKRDGIGHGEFALYVIRPKQTTVKSSCCLQPRKCCLTAATRRWPMALGVMGPPFKAAYTPSIWKSVP